MFVVSTPPIRYQIHSLQIFSPIWLVAYSFCWWPPLHCRTILVWCKKQLHLLLHHRHIQNPPQTHSNTHTGRVGYVRYKRRFLSFKGKTKFINFQVILKLYGRDKECLWRIKVEFPEGQNWYGVASQRNLTFRDMTVSTQEKNNDKGKTTGRNFIQQTYWL